MVQKIERFANLAASTLGSTISSGATSLSVVSAASFPTSGQFRVVIDQEIFLVTNVSGNTFTVTPGYESSTQIGHTAGAAVRLLLTAGIMQAVYPTGRRASGAVINMDTNDGILEVNNTAPAPVTVNLPTDPVLYKPYPVVDFAGNAGTHNITVTSGGFSDVINVDGISATYYFNGTVWKVTRSSASQDLSGYVPVTRTINGQPLDADIELTAADVGAVSGSGTCEGDNTGDQVLYAGRVVTAAGAVTMNADDQIVEIAKTTPEDTTVNLPASPVTWKLYTVKDGGFNCAAHNITLVPNAGTIETGTTVVMTRNGQSLSFYWNGANWRIA